MKLKGNKMSNGKILLVVILCVLAIPMVLAQDTESQGIRDILCQKNEQGGWDCSIDQQTQIEVHGTEYSTTDESGKAWLELTKDFQPVNNASCWLYSWYPNMTLWHNRTMMEHREPHGIYFTDFEVPDDLGVYPAIARCQVPETGLSDEFRNKEKSSRYINVRYDGGRIALSYNAHILPDYMPCTSTEGQDNVSLLMYMEEELRAGGIIDESEFRNDGTIEGAPQFGVEGRVDDSIEFTEDDYITINTSESLDITDEITIEGWINAYDTSDDDYTLMSKWSPDNESWDIKPEKRISFWLDGTETSIRNPDVELRDTGWNHIAVTYNGTYINYYVNAELVEQTAATGSIDITDAPVKIGAADLNDEKEYIDGKIDEPMILSKAINQSRIKLHYHHGIGETPTVGGYLWSESIKLEGSEWEQFNADDYIYSNDSRIEYHVMNHTEPFLRPLEADFICNDTGDISECAKDSEEIKLCAYLTRDASVRSPEIQRWSVEWEEEQVREMRGSSEVHVTEPKISNITSYVEDTITQSIWQRLYNLPIGQDDTQNLIIILGIIILIVLSIINIVS